MKTPVEIDESYCPVLVVTINRPHRRNAVDGETAHALWKAFTDFDTDEQFRVAILQGAGGNFCAGADLKSMLNEDGKRDSGDGNPIHSDMSQIAPMGCTRLRLQKPVIAAVSGFAVAGGLELALWCDLRVASEDAVFGVFCRMRGVPLIDGGTLRLPQLIGLSAASDMILTGREVKGDEAKRISLVNYLVKNDGTPQNAAFNKALEIARLLASHPQRCMRNDRLSMLKGAFRPSEAALLKEEFGYGMDTLSSGEFGEQVKAFTSRSKI